MASLSFSCSSFCKSRNPNFSCRRKVQLIPQARFQNFGDEGHSQNAVDTNMRVLIRRMENLRMKERLNTYHYKMEKNGWNYTSRYDVVHKHKMHDFLVTSFQLAHIVCTTIALVFLTGSLSIFLVSFIFSQSNN